MTPTAGGVRRRLPFGVASSCLVLAIAWGSTIGLNCMNSTLSGCASFGLPTPTALGLLAIPVGVVVTSLAFLVPERWFDGVESDGIGRLLFDPGDSTVKALVPIVLGLAAFAPPLFAGEVTSSQSAWSVLAVPYVPTVAFWGAIGLVVAVGPTGTMVADVAILLLAWVGAAALQTVWFYAIAAGVARVGRQVAGSLRADVP